MCSLSALLSINSFIAIIKYIINVFSSKEQLFVLKFYIWSSYTCVDLSIRNKIKSSFLCLTII